MADTIPPLTPLDRLRNVITTGYLLEQAVKAGFITQEDKAVYVKKLNDKSHEILDELVKWIAG